jgi:hypothetical protein
LFKPYKIHNSTDAGYDENRGIIRHLFSFYFLLNRC